MSLVAAGDVARQVERVPSDKRVALLDIPSDLVEDRQAGRAPRIVTPIGAGNGVECTRRRNIRMHAAGCQATLFG